MQEDLRTFIETAKRGGATDAFLATLLEESGWPKREIWLAFSQIYSVPRRPTGVESAKDAFFHLLAFSTLATWTWALGSMLFTFINRWFPDTLYNSNFRSTDYSVASEMASIIVAFPLYLFVMRMIDRTVAAQPEKLESDVRKWLTYIALLLAAGCLMGDVITFLTYLLRGEITERFICKVFVVLAIAGGVFSYYLQSLRAYDPSRNKIFASVATGVVVLVIALGFFRLGPPSNQRLMEADRRRVQDLRGVTSAIYSRKRVPTSLQEMGIASVDPMTRLPYEFHPLSPERYEVCATFAVRFDEPVDTFWSHPAGRYCYTLGIGVLH